MELIQNNNKRNKEYLKENQNQNYDKKTKLLWNALHNNIQSVIDNIFEIQQNDINQHDINSEQNEIRYYKNLVNLLREEIKSLKTENNKLHDIIKESNQNSKKQLILQQSKMIENIKPKNAVQESIKATLSMEELENKYNSLQSENNKIVSSLNITTNTKDVTSMQSKQKKQIFLLKKKLNEYNNNNSNQNQSVNIDIIQKEVAQKKEMQHSNSNIDILDELNKEIYIKPKSSTNTKKCKQKNIKKKTEYNISNHIKHSNKNNFYIEKLSKLQNQLSQTQHKLNDVQKLNKNLKLRLSSN